MKHEEAIALLEQELARFRTESYADLVSRVSTGPIVFERAALSGTTYQLEIDVLWENRPGGNVLVVGSIDDGGLRAFIPLTKDSVKTPG